MTKPYNPSAFPSPGIICPSGLQQGAYEGMSLRDFFAAHAPKAPLWFKEEDLELSGTLDHPMNLEVAWRYRYADAMLAYRETL